MKNSFFICLLIPFILSSCHPAPSPKELLTSRLDSALTRIFPENEPGGSVFISKGDEILYARSFGLADLKTKNKFSDQTVANLGSISKTFVAYGILILQNQGKLSVEDPIGKYFPEFKNKALAEKIKIKHLLMHTSGLPDCRKVDKDSIYYLTANDSENFHPLTLTDTLEFEPGTKWNYSNPAYNGLALIIEKVSKMKWQKFIQENIFDPSGMKDSKITDGSFPDKGVAHGYRLVNKAYEEYDYGECPTFDAAGNGGVWSSIGDLRLYVKAIKAARFTDKATIQRSETIHIPENWNLKDTLIHSEVWFVHPSIMDWYHDKEQCRVIEHNGDQGGFKAHLIMIPESDMTIIWLSNNDKFITNTLRKALFKVGFIK